MPDQPPQSKDPDATPGPRVLIPITISFSVRYVVRTGLLDRIAAVAEPVLATTWDDPALTAEMGQRGIEVVTLPAPAITPATQQALADLDVAFRRRLRSPSTRIDLALRLLRRPTSIRWRRRAAFERDLFRARATSSLAVRRTAMEAALDAEAGLAEATAFLGEHRIDAIFTITPYVVQELLVLHAANRLGLPAATSILSFDNLTTRPPLPVAFDRYLLWNRFNEAELLRGDPRANPADVELVGPAQFDFYADPALIEPEAAWRQRLDLPATGPTVLYGAGPPAISPNEPQYVDHLLDGIADGRLPADLRVVLRRHPIDPPARWERFRGHRSVIFDDPGAIGQDSLRPGQVGLGLAQVRSLCSTLAHTDVHVNASSTMTLDGAFFDKPQIGPAYDAVGPRRYGRVARDLYRREHFEAIMASGGLELATDPDSLVSLVSAALSDPARLTGQRRAMLQELCTYLDGRCTDRVAAGFERFLADRAPI